MGMDEIDALLDASTADTPEAWLEKMSKIGAEGGWYRRLTPDHKALFLQNGRTLLVSFDSHPHAMERDRRLPVGMDLADECDWSYLCLLARRLPWFRAENVYAFFDELVDQGFFEGFDRVLFYGAGPMGYAAATYSVAAPGAEVLLINPPATLAPQVAGWDDRFREARRMDFTSRYGFGPDMVEGARRVTVIHDPRQKLDSMHAALYAAPHIAHISVRHSGQDPEMVFSRMGLLNHIIAAAMAGTLSPAAFGRLWRKRRDDGTYLRHLQMSAMAHPRRELMICRNVVARLDQKRFRKRLAELEG
jgi:hypothetical protein